MEFGINKTKFMNTRSLVIALVAVGAVTGGNLWIHSGDPALGFNRYNKFDISFDYDMRMQLREADLGGYSAPTDTVGSVQVSYQDGDYLQQYGVSWAKPKVIPNYFERSPEGALDYFFENVGMGGTQIVERSECKTTTSGGHEVIHQTFGVPDGGYTIPGIIGAWYCDETGRYRIFYLIYVPDFESIEVPYGGLEQMWSDLLGGLTCHVT
ncbi:hypothetical protein ISS40_08625 [Candidatus Bathyarchaeota archaeon]|nr:hypothetical protein [Candidatus Bathyarchaeota archaeon]